MLLEDMFDSKSSSKFIDSEWMLFKRETQEPSITLSFLFWTVDRLLNVMKRSTISPLTVSFSQAFLYMYSSSNGAHFGGGMVII